MAVQHLMRVISTGFVVFGNEKSAPYFAACKNDILLPEDKTPFAEKKILSADAVRTGNQAPMTLSRVEPERSMSSSVSESISTR